ncbi:cyclic nucleotide-binding domain-containing protein [Pedobacter sp. KLB.chiD]|uniref:cyclic nucleotide-binding domain-containing protein n=1 Tax=Pedobacter sp. KLB.chiD TaxID=3387402 RepID=UPI00399BFFBE
MEGSKILIILKDAKLRAKISDILITGKYLVEFTDNGKKAMELIRNLPIDLIICGMELNGIDGFGVLRMVNKFIDTVSISVVMIVKGDDQYGMRRSMEIGADGFLIDDFDDAELLNQVEARLRKRQLQYEFFLQQQFQQKSPTGMDSGLFWLNAKRETLVPRTFRKKQIIFYKGEPCIGIYYVLSGKIKTFISDSSGRLLITELYYPGEYFGFQDFISGSRMSNTAMVIDDAQVVVIPLGTINKLVQEHPEVANFFAKKLARMAHEKDEQTLELAHAPVRARVSRSIIKLAKKESNMPDNTRLTLPRNDLANVIGIASETLSRILGDFAREGLIEKDGNDIILKKIERLKNVYN